MPEKYTTYYRSVILFGTVRRLTAGEEKRAAILALARRYSPDEPAEKVDRPHHRQGVHRAGGPVTPRRPAAKDAFFLSGWKGPPKCATIEPFPLQPMLA